MKKILKRILVAIATIILIYLMLCVFGSSEMKTERSAVIKAPVTMVFPLINSLQKWEKWDPWHSIDTAAIYSYIGESGEGNIAEWTSENLDVGHGKQTIVKSELNHFVETELWFEDMGTSTGVFAFNPMGDSTQVIWSFKGNVPFLFRGILMFANPEEALGKDFELGLKQLQDYCTVLKRESATQLSVVKERVEPFWILSITDTISLTQISEIHGKLYGEISEYMASNNSKQSGNPIAFWLLWGDTIVIQAGIPIQDSINTNNTRIQCSKVGDCEALKTVHYGWYDSMNETYDVLKSWMEENQFEQSGTAWESYLDPTTVLPDTDMVQTIIYMPVK